MYTSSNALRRYIFCGLLDGVLLGVSSDYIYLVLKAYKHKIAHDVGESRGERPHSSAVE